MKLENKVAIITGAASGIGFASAKKMLEEGACVMLADIKDSLADAAASLQNEEKVSYLKTDVSNEEEVEALLHKTVEKFGKVDIMVANAGIGSYHLAHEETEQDWDRIMGVNLKGVFFCGKHAIKQMLKQGTGGSVINMASILGLSGSPNAFTYCATKGGVISMTRSMAVSYAKEKIRVNAIAPGYVYTPILDGMTEEIEQALISAHPVGRLGNPEEIASAVAFLASDESSFVTGITMPVDGGYTAQ